MKVSIRIRPTISHPNPDAIAGLERRRALMPKTHRPLLLELPIARRRDPEEPALPPAYSTEPRRSCVGKLGPGFYVDFERYDVLTEEPEGGWPDGCTFGIGDNGKWIGLIPKGS